MPMPLRACRPRLTASQGRGDQERRATATRKGNGIERMRASPLAIVVCLVRACCALALDLPSPLRRRPGGGQARRVASAWMPMPVWRQSMDALSTNPEPGRGPHRSQTGEAPEGGWPSLLVTSLLATQRESDSASAGGRNALLDQREKQHGFALDQRAAAEKLPTAGMSTMQRCSGTTLTSSSPSSGERKAESVRCARLTRQRPESCRSAPATRAARSGAPTCRPSRPPRSPACPSPSNS